MFRAENGPEDRLVEDHCFCGRVGQEGMYRWVGIAYGSYGRGKRDERGWGFHGKEKGERMWIVGRINTFSD